MDPNMKEALDNLKEKAAVAAVTVSRAAEVATRKAGQLAGNAKLNLQLVDLNTDIDMLFKEVGKIVYLTHTGVEVDAEELEGKMAQIDEKYTQISRVRARLDSRRCSVKCPHCGTECDKGDAFCRHCGGAL